jgi:hypothetical protein
LRTGAFKGSAAVAAKDDSGAGNAAAASRGISGAAAKEPKGAKKDSVATAAAASDSSDTGEVTGPVLHLASFRTKEAAQRAWQEALALNKSILGQHHELIRKIDLGTGKGVFFRLMVGPFTSLADAETTCIRLKANNQFCRASTSASGT